jgi:hypothetical protein
LGRPGSGIMDCNTVDYNTVQTCNKCTIEFIWTGLVLGIGIAIQYRPISQIKASG